MTKEPMVRSGFGVSARLGLRLLWRGLRAGELRLMVVALVVAVASVTAVGFLADRVRGALDREALQMLGADVLLTADHVWPGEFAAEAKARGLRVAETLSFPSMVMRPDPATGLPGAQLADIKAVTEGYPFRGQLRSAPAVGALDAVTQRIPQRGEAWIDDRLAAMLDVDVGAPLQLGQLTLQVGAILTLEPDRGVSFFSVAPRLMMHMDDAAATGLIQTGARARWRLLVAAPENERPEAVQPFRSWAEARLGRGEKIEGSADARPEMRAVLDRAQRYLGLASMLAVVLASAGLGLAVRRFVARQVDPFALLRCFGATQAVLLRIALTQLVVLATFGGALGVALGYLVQAALQWALVSVLAVALPAPTFWPALQGLSVALVLVFAFAWPPFMQLRQVSTLRVLRREWGVPAWSALGSWGLGAAAVFGLIVWSAGELRLGVMVAGGLMASLLVFTGVARACVAALQGVVGRLPTGTPMRQGILALVRRPWATTLQMVALAIGVWAVLLLSVVRGEVLNAWQRSVPADAPNRFVVNIQPDQVAEVASLLQKNGVPATLSPMIRGRLTRINGEAVRAENYTEERAQRLVEREFNLSYRSDLPPGNRVVAGRWLGAEDVADPGVSVESGLAKTLGLAVGDLLEFDLAGTPVSARVVGLRQLDWDSMQVNFFVLFAPGVIDQSPASYITSFYLHPERHEVSKALLRAHPNLTVIDISSILRQLTEVIAQVSLAVELLFGLTVMAGGVVLFGALLAVFDERQRELAIVRALGGSRALLQRMLAAEFFVLGAVSGLIAAAGALAVGEVVAGQVFELPMRTAWWLMPGALLVVGLGIAGVSRWVGRALLGVSPLEALRAAE